MSARLKRLFQLLDKNGLDGLLVSSAPNVTYLSAFKNNESWIVVSPQGLYFITDSRYLEQAQKEAKGFKVILRDKQSVTQIVGDLVKKMKLKTLGFESPIVTHSFFIQLEKAVGPDILRPSYDLVETLRLKKDRSEIEKLKVAADIAVKGYYYVKQTARPGMTEREIQGRLEHYTKSIGSEKPAFDLIVASSAKSSMPHAQVDHTKIRNNDILLIDMGCVHEGYHSDLTRPIFLGRMSALQKKVCQIVWDAQRAGIKKAGPGVPAKEVDAACRDYIRQKGYGDLFGHGTGHGVGLEIHEAPSVSPRSQTILEPGMVITVEPGIYLPGKFGVRIEDMVLITEKGNEVLTRDLDKPV